MDKEMLVPLFSYDTITGQIDVGCLGGDVCYVMHVITGSNDPDIENNQEKIARIVGSGKKLISMDNLSTDEISEMLSFIDIVVKNPVTENINEWNKVYDYFQYELLKKRNYD